LESVQEDALTDCGLLDCYDIWTCEMWGGPQGIRSFSANATSSLKPNPVNFVGVLNACAGLVALEEGRRGHEQIIRSGFESNVFVRNCLIDIYVKCGRMNDAQSVFNKMPSHSVVSWIAMILGHMKCGQGQRGHWTYFNNCRREVWH